MADKEDYLEVSAFLEEMISLIDRRLKQQERSIAGLQAEMREIRNSLRDVTKERHGTMIDKSVLKVLKQ
jgi:uncharacterized coiled-coil protein SlyX